MNNKQCVLAYSGGLDTSAIVPWLVDRGYQVHAVLVDVGQQEDMKSACAKAIRIGAVTAVIRDAKPAMFESVVPQAIGLGATYEGNYRLGTALARPFIALEQVRAAKQLGGATLIHGATGKGNDQIRFEFAYRSLAPECPVLAPWKTWEFGGRLDLIEYLRSKGLDDGYEVSKDYSMDENLWHLSVEGGVLEDARATVDVAKVLDAVKDRFAGGVSNVKMPGAVSIELVEGLPVACDGVPAPLPVIIAQLNQRFRGAPWAWDLAIENRFTGIKSRGLYINPAAKLLHFAVDALARTCLNKAAYDRYVELGRDYGAMIYRGEFFSDQRVMLDAAAGAVMAHLTGSVTVQLTPAPYASRIDAPKAIFRKSVATFEKSDYSHGDAEGFIKLNWLSLIGRSFEEEHHAGAVETGHSAEPGLRGRQSVPDGGLVPVPA